MGVNIARQTLSCLSVSSSYHDTGKLEQLFILPDQKLVEWEGMEEEKDMFLLSVHILSYQKISIPIDKTNYLIVQRWQKPFTLN